ncbi:MAG TPA: SDR family NAD(P)-dependent oxidoreductase, partial [Gaiellaceae bacterium]|nr:SDR family NAD(P)-dependent oxidoreductase [Gaiellaceae bacterium]
MPSRALVTGGGRGIGADIARALAGEGWHVTVTGRTPEQVAAIAAELGIKDWQFWALRQLKGWNHRSPDVARTVSAAWARRRARRASPDPDGGGAGPAEDAALAGSAGGDAAAPRDTAAPRAAAPSRPRARRREDARALGL